MSGWHFVRLAFCPHTFETQVRTDVSVNCPAGKNWVSVDGEYKAIAVSGKVDDAIFFLVVLIAK